MPLNLWPTDAPGGAERLATDDVFAAGSAKPHIEYQHNFLGWVHEKLGVPRASIQWTLHPAYEGYTWDGTKDPLLLIATSLENNLDVGVESGTGTGKSYIAALIILWFLACWENAEVYTFAPTEKQLKLFIWKNIGLLWPKFVACFPAATLTDLTIRMRGGLDESWAAHGYPVGVEAGTTVATRAAGMHAEHMLLVYEETPGIHLQVMEAGENTCTAPHNRRLAIGNPNHQLDSLHKFCLSPGVVHVRISATDHPNVVTDNAGLIPGAISAVSLARRREKYGEESPVYQSRVRGISPEQASDSLIRVEWLRAAAARWNARQEATKRYRDGKPSIPGSAKPFSETITGKGVDVANSEHGDRACIVDFAGNAAVRLEAMQCPDSNALGRKVFLEMQAAGLARNRIGVDTVGVGAGTFNELRRLNNGRDVQALVGSAVPMKCVARAADGTEHEWTGDINQFRNLRSQMYWQLREDLRTGVIDLPEDNDLWEELVCPTYTTVNKTLVEPKDEIKDRLGRSPDKADALVYANWVREREVILPEKDDKYDKTPHVARRMGVDDAGHLVPEPKAPKSIEEVVSALGGRESLQKTPLRRLLPLTTFRRKR